MYKRLSSKVKLIKTFLTSCSANVIFQNQKGKEEMTDSHQQRIHRGDRPCTTDRRVQCCFFLRFRLSFFVVMLLGVFFLNRENEFFLIGPRIE